MSEPEEAAAARRVSTRKHPGAPSSAAGVGVRKGPFAPAADVRGRRGARASEEDLRPPPPASVSHKRFQRRLCRSACVLGRAGLSASVAHKGDAAERGGGAMERRAGIGDAGRTARVANSKIKRG